MSSILDPVSLTGVQDDPTELSTGSVKQTRRELRRGEMSVGNTD